MPRRPEVRVHYEGLRLTVAKTAGILGVHKDTIYRRIRKTGDAAKVCGTPSRRSTFGDQKRCPKCGGWYDLSNFGRAGNRWQSYCKPCKAAARRIRNAARRAAAEARKQAENEEAARRAAEFKEQWEAIQRKKAASG